MNTIDKCTVPSESIPSPENLDVPVHDRVNEMREKILMALEYVNVGLIPNTSGALLAYMATITDKPNGFWICLGISAFEFVYGFKQHEEYKKLKSLLENHGFKERIVKPKSFSWCQRHFSKIAAKNTGYTKELEGFYDREGHKPWHIYPDAKGYDKYREETSRF